MRCKRCHSPFFCVSPLLFSRGVLLSSMVYIITYRPSRRAAQQYHAPHHRNTAPYTVGVATSSRNIAPANLRRKAATDVLIEKIKLHRDWPVHNDVFAHPPVRLRSRKPLWLDLTTDSDIKRGGNWQEQRSLGFSNRG